MNNTKTKNQKSNYDSVKKRYDAAVKKANELNTKAERLYELLKQEKKKLSIACGNCGAEIPVAEIELIQEIYSLGFDYDRQDTRWGEKYYFVCPKCTECLIAPSGEPFKTDGGLDNFNNYVKAIHKYYSDSNPTGRVKELLQPSIDREKKKRDEREKQYKIKQAKEVLRIAGVKFTES